MYNEKNKTMTSYTKDNHTVITAGDGKFLMRRDGAVYGKAISLGCHDLPENYDELPLSELPDSGGNSGDSGNE
jgi:hypothetical protein